MKRTQTILLLICCICSINLLAAPYSLYTTDHGNFVSFHWSGDAVQNGWWVDVTTHGNGTTGNWSNSNFYHKPLSPSNGSHETNTFALYHNWYYNSISNGSAPMNLQQGTRYYWRIFNGSTHFEGPSFVFGQGATSSQVVLNSNGVSNLMWPFRYHKDDMRALCGSGFHVGEDYYADDWRHENGDDWSCGLWLYAPISGTILFLDESPEASSYGNQVIIRSDANPNFVVRLAHLASTSSSLSVGTHVNAGEYIGDMGETGSNNCHLHIVLYKNLGTTQINNLSNGWSASWNPQTQSTSSYYAATFDLSVPNPWYEGRGSTCYAGPGSFSYGRQISEHQHHEGALDGNSNIGFTQNTMDVYPNPVTDNSTINFKLTTDSQVNISVFSSDGKKITELLKNKSFKAGSHQVPLGLSNLKSGVYLVQIKTDIANITRKVIIQ